MAVRGWEKTFNLGNGKANFSLAAAPFFSNHNETVSHQTLAVACRSVAVSVTKALLI